MPKRAGIQDRQPRSAADRPAPSLQRRSPCHASSSLANAVIGAARTTLGGK